jgi:predicted unusual protein kinase regulating ubiquinone biosynthesis (AarF/ABC1/UbiB family)
MGISFRPGRLRRYRDFARLLWRHGRSEAVRAAADDTALRDDRQPTNGEAVSEAQRFADDLEKMGPAFVKMGQLLSTRGDILPAAYVKALERLQDHVEPVPYEEIARVVEAELGAPLEQRFQSFERRPLASASLGQVHRATLPSGAAVAVKVQRPGVREQIAEDFEALHDLAAIVDRHTEWGRKHGSLAILEEFRRTLLEELDYRLEARNLQTLARNLQGFERIMVPLPVDEYTTSRVLVMDYVRGRKLSPVARLRRWEDDGAELAEELFRAYLQQILVDGFFHADPHPGNVFLTDDGRLALLDLGMVARVSPGMQERLLELLLAVAEGRGEATADAAVRIGTRRADFDEAEFRKRVREFVAQSGGASLKDIEIGRVILEGAKLSGDCGIDPPRELTLLGKALLNLDSVGRMLDPEFNPNASIRRNAANLMRHRVAKSLTPENLLSTFLQLKEFVGKLPTRAGRILESMANNELEIKVDAIDEERLISGLEKIANRITVGLVMAALIVAAALLIRVPTSFQLFGYPGIAILFFVLAAGGGLALVASIVVNDHRERRR